MRSTIVGARLVKSLASSLGGAGAPGRRLHAYTALGSIGFALACTYTVETWGDAYSSEYYSRLYVHHARRFDLQTWMNVGVALSWGVATLALFGRTLGSFLAVLLAALCVGYEQVTPDTMFGMRRLGQALEACFGLALVIHLPVLVASARRDLFATMVLVVLGVAGGISVPCAWAIHVHPEITCDPGALDIPDVVRREACVVVQERWGARGVEAARLDLADGIHRVLRGGMFGRDDALMQAYAWDRYEVWFESFFGCLPAPTQEAYAVGYNSVMRDRVAGRLPNERVLLEEAREYAAGRDIERIRPIRPSPPRLDPPVLDDGW